MKRRIRSQVVVLRVFYDNDEEGKEGKIDPFGWDWASLIDEPIRDSVEVLAFGPVVDYPRPKR